MPPPARGHPEVPPTSPDTIADRASRDDARSLRVVRRLAFVWSAWVVALAAVALGADAVGDLLAAQGKLVFLAGLVLVLVVRGAGSAERASWWCFAAAVLSYLTGAATFEFHYRGLAEHAGPQVVRRRLPRVSSRSPSSPSSSCSAAGSAG